MKSIVGLVVLLLCSIGSECLCQTELQEDVRYEGNTRLSISSLGISFVIPAGWFGGVPSGSSYMVLADESNEVTIIVTADEMKEAEVLGELQRQLSVDETISISPIGTVQKDGKRWWGDYRVNGASQEMKSYVEVRLGSYSIGAGCIVLSIPSSFERGKKAARELLQSISFKAPQTTTTSTAGTNQPYSDYLKGKALKYYYTQGDFSDSDLIHLCSDGTFIRKKSTVSGGVTGTGSLWGGDQGTWQASGQGAEGSLILNNRDGSRTTFELQYRNGTKGVGLYLNGYRYYVDASTQCN